MNASDLKTLVKRGFNRMGVEIFKLPGGSESGHEVARPSATWAPWNEDADFREVWDTIRDATLVDIYRCHELWSLVGQCAALPEGAILEVGVWRGGTGGLIASAASRAGIDEPVFLADTFEGVVKAGARDDAYVGGEHGDTSQARVESLIGDRLGLSNVRILKGTFPDETAAQIPADLSFRFCHVDVDVYASARDTVEWIWDRLVPGGLIVFDDYGFYGCDGIREYVDEQRGQPDRLVVHNLNGHAIVVKR